MNITKITLVLGVLALGLLLFGCSSSITCITPVYPTKDLSNLSDFNFNTCTTIENVSEAFHKPTCGEKNCPCMAMDTKMLFCTSTQCVSKDRFDNCKIISKGG